MINETITELTKSVIDLSKTVTEKQKEIAENLCMLLKDAEETKSTKRVTDILFSLMDIYQNEDKSNILSAAIYAVSRRCLIALKDAKNKYEEPDKNPFSIFKKLIDIKDTSLYYAYSFYLSSIQKLSFEIQLYEIDKESNIDCLNPIILSTFPYEIYYRHFSKREKKNVEKLYSRIIDSEKVKESDENSIKLEKIIDEEEKKNHGILIYVLCKRIFELDLIDPFFIEDDEENALEIYQRYIKETDGVLLSKSFSNVF